MTTETNEKNLNIKEQNVTDIKFTALVVADNFTHAHTHAFECDSHSNKTWKQKERWADRTHANGESYIMYVNLLCLPYMLDTKRLHTTLFVAAFERCLKMWNEQIHYGKKNLIQNCVSVEKTWRWKIELIVKSEH